MSLIVLGFLTILVITFLMVILMTRRGAIDLTIDRRIASIQLSSKQAAGASHEAAQFFKTTKTGSFGWLEDMLDHYEWEQTLQKHILQADSSTTVATLLLASVGLFLAGYAITWLVAEMVLIDLFGGAALACIPLMILSFKRRRRISAFNAALAESIDMLARALRAGHSVASAMEMLADSAPEPAATEFGEMFKQQNLGLPMRDALMQLLDRVPSPDLRVLVTAILVQRETGGNLPEILDRTVFVIRDRLRIQGEIQTQTAQGRLTGWILTALPIVMLVLLNVVNPGYSNILLHDPVGRKVIYFSVGMLVVGSLIIRRIVNGIEV
jgi:tight adherence protein B